MLSINTINPKLSYIFNAFIDLKKTQYLKEQIKKQI